MKNIVLMGIFLISSNVLAAEAGVKYSYSCGTDITVKVNDDRSLVVTEKNHKGVFKSEKGSEPTQPEYVDYQGSLMNGKHSKKC